MLHSLHNLLTSFQSTRYVVASFLVGKINAVDQSRQGLDHGKREKGGGEELSGVDIVEFLTACFSNCECTVYI